jgi:translocation and assembly module TamB
VSGFADLDVTITGDGLKYGDNGALAMTSDYTVTIPGLHAADATISATTRGTFVTVAGQNINELTAKVEYQGRQVGFDATAKQPQRTLQAAGALTLHPDHQELHLDRLNLQTAGTTWQLAGDAKPAIDYGGTTVGVDDLRLVSGDQQISASGKFGAQGESLEVELTNISVANIDALMLRPPQFFGRLNASATISGAKSSPEVAAEFAVRQGNFQDYYYDSFTGTVNFNGRGVTLDATLQQDAATSLTAKGYVPMALFASTSAPATGRSSADDRFDLHVESNAIDLGLIQGFTTAVVGVSGTAQVKLDVTGTAAAPRPEGTLTVQNAAFTVSPTGVTYTDLDGRVELQNDRIHIDEIRVLDNHKSPLSIRGDLALHGRDVGDVALSITADDFKVIDNEMGNVRVKSDLRVGGGLRAPVIDGDLAVTTGALNLDPILARVGDSAYATTQVEYQPAASDTSSQPPGGFAAVQMDVHLTVPDDLVVKAGDLRLPNAPISLGAMTMTLGGDVRIRKDRGEVSPNAVGVVRTIRGHYDFQGRRFEILRDGSVRFEGLTPPNPSLDIRTERVIRAVAANVTIRGSLRQPEVVLSSVPPLEQADILSLIVFNQPINQLGEGQQASLAQRAQELATGAVAGELAKSIGSALNLSEFDINTGSDNGGVSLRVGQQVGQDLYIKVEQGIGDNNQTNIVLEYELAKWLRLRTNVLQGSSSQQQLFQKMQGTGVDLLFFFSY